MVVLVGKWTIKPDQADAYVEMYQEVIPQCRKEPGNGLYQLLKVADQENVFITIEEWETQADMDAHVAGAPCQAVMEKVPNMLAGEPEAYACELLV